MCKLLVGLSDGGVFQGPWWILPSRAGVSPMPPWGRIARYHTILDPFRLARRGELPSYQGHDRRFSRSLGTAEMISAMSSPTPTAQATASRSKMVSATAPNAISAAHR
jgi:hypothetical protein